MILCLDKSGSMSGRPYDALKEGALLVGKGIFENKEFEHFATVFYDSNAQGLQAKSFEEYQPAIMQSRAGGGTSFGQAFSWVINFVNQTKDLRDISIIFFTDGLDGDQNLTQTNLQLLQNTLNQREISSRFLTIGFSRDHDAVFLNKIAQSGSELGNFFFIDTSGSNYTDQVKECL